MNKYIKLTALAFAASFAFAASSAHATDGVYEINQACAAVGCFDGDDPGFPVEIKNPGSYRLTSNLKADADTVVIQAGLFTLGTGGWSLLDSSIDLNGFSVQGLCGTSTCADAGTKAAVVISGNNNRIMNGSISGAKGIGLVLTGSSNVAEKLRVHHNGSYGIAPGLVTSTVINEVTVTENENIGIFGLNNSKTFVVRNSMIANNGGETGQNAGVCEANVYMNNDADLANQERCSVRLSRTSECIKNSGNASCGG